MASGEEVFAGGLCIPELGCTLVLGCAVRGWLEAVVRLTVGDWSMSAFQSFVGQCGCFFWSAGAGEDTRKACELHELESSSWMNDFRLVSWLLVPVGPSHACPALLMCRLTTPLPTPHCRCGLARVWKLAWLFPTLAGARFASLRSCCFEEMVCRKGAYPEVAADWWQQKGLTLWLLKGFPPCLSR